MSITKRILDADVIKLRPNYESETEAGTLVFNGTQITSVTPLSVSGTIATASYAISASYATSASYETTYELSSSHAQQADNAALVTNGAYINAANTFTTSQIISGSITTTESASAGKLIAGVGSQAGPSITFNENTDLGFYQTDANTIGVASNDTFIARFSVVEGIGSNNADLGATIVSTLKTSDNVQITGSVTILSGSLNLVEIVSESLSAPTAGAIIYSGSKHYGWNGSSWNAFY